MKRRSPSSRKRTEKAAILVAEEAEKAAIRAAEEAAKSKRQAEEAAKRLAEGDQDGTGDHLSKILEETDDQ